MLERIATYAPATAFYILTVFFGLFGVILLIVPIVGVPLLALSFLSYTLARIAKRKARELDVRRQQGG